MYSLIFFKKSGVLRSCKNHPAWTILMLFFFVCFFLFIFFQLDVFCKENSYCNNINISSFNYIPLSDYRAYYEYLSVSAPVFLYNYLSHVLPKCKFKTLSRQFNLEIKSYYFDLFTLPLTVVGRPFIGLSEVSKTILTSVTVSNTYGYNYN